MRMGLLDSIDLEKSLLESNNDFEEISLLKGGSCNQWIEEELKRPDPKNLFQNLVLENQVVCLFARPGVGKSFLAVQIGESIAKTFGYSVVILDLELSAKQFQKRFAQKVEVDGKVKEQRHIFPNTLMRFEINPEKMCSADLTNDLVDSVEQLATRTQAKVIIIDNLTYLVMDDSNGTEARAIMQRLMELKKRLGLTIIVVAHCPKIADGIPLSLNHLSGSSKLANFFDNVLGLARSSKGPNIRYLKTLKSRDIENDGLVAELHLILKDNALCFEFVGRNDEMEHLGEASTDKRSSVLALRDKGMKPEEIAKALGISRSSAYSYLKQ